MSRSIGNIIYIDNARSGAEEPRRSGSRDWNTGGHAIQYLLALGFFGILLSLAHAPSAIGAGAEPPPAYDCLGLPTLEYAACE